MEGGGGGGRRWTEEGREGCKWLDGNWAGHVLTSSFYVERYRLRGAEAQCKFKYDSCFTTLSGVQTVEFRRVFVHLD